MEPQALTPWIETQPFEVRYAETDAMGIVYYANYLVWFEVARGAFCQAYGIDYQAVEQDGTPLAVVEAYCRYRSPARYGDRVIVRVRLTELKGSTMRFEYQTHPMPRNDTPEGYWLWKLSLTAGRVATISTAIG